MKTTRTKSNAHARQEGLAALEARVAALEERLGAAASRSGAVESPQAVQPPTPTPQAPAPDRPWAVNVLQQRTGPPFEGDASRGSLLYAGPLLAPGTGLVAWQMERPVPGVFARAWGAAAPVLAALGHPVRLEIVRRLLGGAHSSQELQQIPELGSTAAGLAERTPAPREQEGESHDQEPRARTPPRPPGRTVGR